MRNLPAILLMLVVVAGCARSAPGPSPDDTYGRALDVYTSEREELDRLESVALVKSVEFAQLRSAIVTELAVLDDQEKQMGSHKDSVDEIAGNRTDANFRLAELDKETARSAQASKQEFDVQRRRVDRAKAKREAAYQELK